MIRTNADIDADTLFHFVNVTPKPKSLRIEAVNIHGKTHFALITSDNARCLTATHAECVEMKHKMENAI